MNGFEFSKGLLGALAGVSAVTFIGSVLILPYIIIRLPADHFLRDAPPPPTTRREVLGWVARNVCGTALVLLGIAMLALPGQGLLTIFIGLSWMSFPRKLDLERWIVTRMHLLGPLNWIRKERHKPPLEAPGTRHGKGEPPRQA